MTIKMIQNHITVFDFLISGVSLDNKYYNSMYSFYRMYYDDLTKEIFSVLKNKELSMIDEEVKYVLNLTSLYISVQNKIMCNFEPIYGNKFLSIHNNTLSIDKLVIK